MNPIRCAILILLFAFPLTAQEDGNLIEYSYGGFASGMDFLGPMLLPPIVKIYSDGRIVFVNEKGVWEARIESRRLDRLKKDLAKNPLLRDTAVIPVKRGASPGYHGGMAYIRYLSGEEEVIIGAFLLPSSGPWNRLVERIRSFIPSGYRPFAPAALTAHLSHGASWRQDPVEWPFSDELRLGTTLDGSELEINDRRMTQFILEHGRGGFSWLEILVMEGEDPYTLRVTEVPGWYEPQPIEMTLGYLVSTERAKQVRTSEEPQ